MTRPALQAGNLCSLIENRGGVPIRFPTLEIAALEPEPQLLKLAAGCEWLIFTSSNAVNFAIKAFGGKMSNINRPRIAAVGRATAHALQQSGWQVDCVPISEFNSEGLLAEAQLQNIAGKTCVIVRGAGGREVLAETLLSRGAQIFYLEVYQRLCPEADSKDVQALLATRQLGAATVTSAEALHNVLVMLDHESIALLRALPLVVVSDRIRQIAEQLGFKRIAVCHQPTDEAILESLTTLFNGENSGRSN